MKQRSQGHSASDRRPERAAQHVSTRAPARALIDLLSDVSEMVRLRVLRVLEREELSVGEVAQVVQLPQSTVSRHLKILSEGGWVVRRASGTAMLYRLVLDEVAPEARALWVTIRENLASSQGSELSGDSRRLESVLAERASDPQAFFGRVAGEWDSIRGQWFGERFTPVSLLSLLPPEWVVADLGCGTGNVAELLAPVVKKVVAVDQSGPMLGAARKRLSGASNVSFHEGSLEELPLANGSVDACVAVLVLHHVASPERALKEMRRVLRKPGREGPGGGVALIVDMLEHGRAEYRHTLAHKHLGFGARAMQRMCRDAGFGSAAVRELPAEPESKGPGLFVATARVAEG